MLYFIALTSTKENALNFYLTRRAIASSSHRFIILSGRLLNAINNKKKKQKNRATATPSTKDRTYFFSKHKNHRRMKERKKLFKLK